MIGSEWLMMHDGTPEAMVDRMEMEAMSFMGANMVSPNPVEVREQAIDYLTAMLCLHGHVDVVDMFRALEKE